MLEWVIIYDDGTEVSNLGVSPALAPKCGVLCIVRKDPDVGRYVERGENFYVWRSEVGGWRGCDQFGLYDYLMQPGSKVVLFGRTVSEVEWTAALERALNYPGLLPKSAWRETERRPT